MFFIQKRIRLDDAIRKWKDDGAKKITIEPFEAYRLRYGALYAVLTMVPSSVYLNNDGEPDGFEIWSEANRGDLMSLGRRYLPDKGKHRYMEQGNPDQELSDVNDISERLRENQLEVKIVDSHRFVGETPSDPKLII